MMGALFKLVNLIPILVNFEAIVDVGVYSFFSSSTRVYLKRLSSRHNGEPL